MNFFLNLLVCNVIERKIKKEKVQMKPPHDFLTLNYSTAVRWRKKNKCTGLQSIKCTRYIHQNKESYAYWCQQRMSRWGNRIEQKTLICANLATILSLPRSFFVSRKSQRRRGSAFVVSLFCCLDLSAVVT